MNFKKITYLIFQILMFFTLILAFFIYTSQTPISPIQENSGIQFLVILIICSPILLILGLFSLLLKVTTPKFNLFFPFYSSIGLSLPLLIDSRLHHSTIFIGTLICIFFLIENLFLLFNSLKIFYF
ncbi:hypothetical protein C4D26_14660 [Clostridium perfringens]